MENYTMTKLLSIELDTDFEYDVTHGEAQAELDAYVGNVIDVSDFIDHDYSTWEAARDWLTEETGLLIAHVSVA